jgi:hypothetical protein
VETNYGQLYAAAIAEGGGGSETLPDGTYNMKIASVKPGPSKTGKFQVGIRLTVVDGPHSGKSTWINQTFSPENPQAVAIFLRSLRDFGVPMEAITAGAPPAELTKYIAVESFGVAEMSHHVHGTNDDGSPRKYQDCKRFKLQGPIANPIHSLPLPGAVKVPQVGSAPDPF